jgi:hypothetical protein
MKVADLKPTSPWFCSYFWNCVLDKDIAGTEILILGMTCHKKLKDRHVSFSENNSGTFQNLIDI